MKNKRTISQVKKEISELTSYYSLTNDKRVRDLIVKIQQENKPKVDQLKLELAELENNKPKPKPRWPENTPADVLKECEEYWKGSTEFYSFRIHCWNDKVICTGYPSGGYSDNSGWHPTPVSFEFISRTEKGYGGQAKRLADLRGRQSQKILEKKLEELS